MKRKSIALLILFFSFETFFAQSQTFTSTLQLTPEVQKSIELALKKNTEVKNKRIEAEKVSYQRKEVLQKYIPRIEGSAMYNYFDTDTKIDLKTKHIPLLEIPIFDGAKSASGYGNVLVGQVKATAIIFSGLQIPYGAKALKNKEEGLKELVEVSEDDLIVELITSFDKINLLDSLQQLIKKSDKRLEAENKRVNAAIKEGFAILSDKDKIRMARLELESKKVELEGNRNLLYQKISYLTGMSIDEIKKVQHNFDKILLFDKASFSVDNKPELKALEAFVKAQQYIIKKEKAAYLPKIQAMGGYRYISSFDSNVNLGSFPNLISSGDIPINLGINELTINPMWFIGVGVKWELFSGFERIHKINEAKLDLQILENKYQDAQEKFNLLLNKQQEEYSVELKKLALSEQKVKVAKNNLDIDTKRYKEGFIDVSDRLKAENDYYKAISEYTQQLIAERKAALEIMKTSGQLKKYR